jgi:hypothetical protein
VTLLRLPHIISSNSQAKLSSVRPDTSPNMRSKSTLLLFGAIPLACTQNSISQTIAFNATSISKYVDTILPATTFYVILTSLSNSTTTMLPESTSTISQPSTTMINPIVVPTTRVATATATATVTVIALASANQPLTNSTEECVPAPQGLGPTANCKYQTPGCFLENPNFVHLAHDAQTPENFTRIFTDLHAAVSGANYLEYHELASYDTQKCSWFCDQVPDCQSFNVYFERKPTLNLGPKCRNAPHSTVIKCSLWGQGLHEVIAKNTGETIWDFRVVIAGSNGYNRQGVMVESLEGHLGEGRRVAVWWPMVVGCVFLAWALV